MAKDKPLLNTREAVLARLKLIRNKKQEYFVCISLDAGSRLITRRVVTIGTLTQSLVHPREVFAGPLKDRAASIILAHNHPSGDSQPSKADISSTQQLIAAGILLGIHVDDHIIVAANQYYSFVQHGML